MDNEVFSFKHFKVFHGHSSMKVGVDAVLLGSWTEAKHDIKNILDIGTGCGVISLILAQRFTSAKVTGIDIDEASVREASVNFKRSDWCERIEVRKSCFPDDILKSSELYDLVVSNPPYFNSGIANPVTPREKARHQGRLSVFSIIENISPLLNKDGLLSVIYPFEYRRDVIKKAQENYMRIKRECQIKNRINRPVKRVMMEIQKAKTPFSSNWDIEELILFENDKPTEKYRQLCKDLYLKF